MKYLILLLILNLVVVSVNAETLRVATFNVSMEALNYAVKKNQPAQPNALEQALNAGHSQIANIAEIIQRVNPDIILINEFDNQINHQKSDHRDLLTFIKQYLNTPQGDQAAVNYPYFYQGPVNTGVNSNFDLDNNGVAGQLPGDGFGYGHFAGHFAMAILSKYPIDQQKIRSFQHFKWADMPNALRPVNPNTKESWYTDDEWRSLPLSSKSHWDIPVTVNNRQIHLLASHPTPPVFDGEEDRNGKRNHDEIRFWRDYISPLHSNYIYDDGQIKGGLAPDSRFVILGDLNASNQGGEAILSGIDGLLRHSGVQNIAPQSKGALQHSPDNPYGKYHTAFWRMRADYVLPSRSGLKVINSGVFWPQTEQSTYRLIKNRKASSDHRLVWVDIEVLP